MDTTHNVGTAPAPASTTRFLLSTDRTKSSNDILLPGNRSVTGLVPGDSFGGYTMLRIPFRTPPGVYFLLACADWTNAVTESNETNNCRASETSFTIY